MITIRDSGNNNISYGNLRSEWVRHFLYTNYNVPLIVECIGITYPNPDYFVKRKHSDYFIMELIIEGEGTLVNNDVIHPLKPNTLYLLKPDSRHEYFPKVGAPFKKIWINFFSETFKKTLESLFISDIPVFYDTDLQTYFNHMIDISKTSINNEDICYDVLEILFSILLKLSRAATACTNNSKLAQQIKSFLDNAVFKNISMDEIAERLFKSKSQIIREFKKNFGMTPYNYLLEKRFEMAKSLLCYSDKAINEIATALNFADEHYFSNSFKKRYALTPSNYRLKTRH